MVKTGSCWVKNNVIRSNLKKNLVNNLEAKFVINSKCTFAHLNKTIQNMELHLGKFAYSK